MRGWCGILAATAPIVAAVPARTIAPPGTGAAYAEMLRPWPKVLHDPSVDRHSLCLTIGDCLPQVAR